MNNALACQTIEQLDEGVVLKQMDDLCFVHFSDRKVDATRTRQVGEKLIRFLERTGCRKLVLSFEGLESIYGFLIDSPPVRRRMGQARSSVRRAEPAFVGSDLWVG